METAMDYFLRTGKPFITSYDPIIVYDGKGQSPLSIYKMKFIECDKKIYCPHAEEIEESEISLLPNEEHFGSYGEFKWFYSFYFKDTGLIERKCECGKDFTIKRFYAFHFVKDDGNQQKYCSVEWK
jgi:hypothetical protein